MASTICRKYTNFAWNDTLNWTSGNSTAISYTPTNCPAGARCNPITYYQPTSPIPVNYVYTNQPDYWRGYQGFELSARKRFSRSWMMNAGYSYNNAPVHYDSPAAYVGAVQNRPGGRRLQPRERQHVVVDSGRAERQ